MPIRKALKVLLPAWYLPSGVTNATVSQLETAALSCERWGLGGAGLVVFGVIAELIIAWAQPPYAAFLTESAFADGAVAVGITIEVLLGTMWNGRIQTELRDRSNKQLETAEKTAGDAIERAAKLEKEAADARGRVADLERLTAWRHISPEQSAEISSALKFMADSIRVLVEYERADPEACSYSYEIATIFSVLGVKSIRWGPNSFMGAAKFGLYATSEADINLPFVRGIFEKAKMPVDEMGMTLGLKLTSPGARPNLYFFVGTKPPPFFREIAIEETSSPARLSDTVEMVQRLSPLDLSDDQKAALETALRAMTGMVRIWYIFGDVESESLARQLHAIFRKAKWTAGLTAAKFSELRWGIVVVKEELASGFAGQAVLEAALSAAAIPYALDRLPGISMESTEDAEGSLVSPTRARLYIGPKDRSGAP